MLEKLPMYNKYIKAIQRAEDIAYECHKDQKDKAGRSYIFHTLAVAANTYDILMEIGEPISSSLYSICYIVALLHDVIEDANYNLQNIEKEFGYDVAWAVCHLTRTRNQKYSDYILNIHEKAAKNKLDSSNISKALVVVKLADLRHSSDRSRLNEITEKDERRFAKYELARKVLLYGRESDIEKLKEYD